VISAAAANANMQQECAVDRYTFGVLGFLWCMCTIYGHEGWGSRNQSICKWILTNLPLKMGPVSGR